MEARPHPNQHARLDALHSFEVLDTDAGGTLSLEEFLPTLLRGLHEVRQVDIESCHVLQ